MKALLCRNFGPPENLALVDLPEPVPASGEIVVRIEAVALNYFDLLIIDNRYQTKPELPFSPGGEFAGIVERVGENVAELQPGQRVFGYSGYGACRQKIAIPADQVAPMPDRLSFAKAAGLCITYGTAMHGLSDRGQLKAGETLAVLGASGGAGLAAVEVGRKLGATVIACASSAEKLSLASAHGATLLFDYGDGDLKHGLKMLTGGRGVDVIYDPVGGSLAEPAVRSMAWGGRYLVVGFAGGDIPRIPLNLLLLKSCDMRGVFWGEFTRREPQRHRDNMATLAHWAANGQIAAHVGATFPLARTPEALRAIADRKAAGKLVIEPWA